MNSNSGKCILALSMHLAESQMLSLHPPVASRQPFIEDDVLIPVFFFKGTLSHRVINWPHISRQKQFKAWPLISEWLGYNPGPPFD